MNEPLAPFLRIEINIRINWMLMNMGCAHATNVLRHQQAVSAYWYGAQGQKAQPK